MLTFKGLSLQYQELETLPTDDKANKSALNITPALKQLKTGGQLWFKEKICGWFFWPNADFSAEIHSKPSSIVHLQIPLSKTIDQIL